MEAQVTIQAKIEQALALAEQHKLCSESLHMQNLVGESVDVPALAKALGVAVEALKQTSKHNYYCDVVPRSSPGTCDACDALAEIEKLLEGSAK